MNILNDGTVTIMGHILKDSLLLTPSGSDGIMQVPIKIDCMESTQFVEIEIFVDGIRISTSLELIEGSDFDQEVPSTYWSNLYTNDPYQNTIELNYRFEDILGDFYFELVDAYCQLFVNNGFETTGHSLEVYFPINDEMNLP